MEDLDHGREGGFPAQTGLGKGALSVQSPVSRLVSCPHSGEVNRKFYLNYKMRLSVLITNCVLCVIMSLFFEDSIRITRVLKLPYIQTWFNIS